MHDLPRKLSAEALARLFDGRTRFVERLSRRPHPLAGAAALLRALPTDELIEALNAHPRIGARRLSPASAREQGGGEDPAVLAELATLNEAYEEKFGFRFVVFVNRRPKSEILRVLRRRLARSRREELRTGVAELVAIARDRYRAASGTRLPTGR
jgi:2-oxo-4-hydroxy-4-carboxy--5-ureidoimidazoline (OHCU) decarboxylase